MSEDNFEYKVTFPFPIPETKRNGSLSDVQTSHRDNERTTHEPVVFLLGWMGAEDRHLAKYSVIYENLGFITIRYTVPTFNLFIRPWKSVPPLSRKVISLLKDLKLTKHPIMFHLFSNGGGWAYHYISKALESEEFANLSVKGCIFDSVPSTLSILKTSSAFHRSQQGNFQFLLTSIVFVYMVLLKVYVIIMILDFSFDFKRIPPYTTVKEPFRWPQLFIYSKSDDVIPYGHVESFAAERKLYGVDVRMKVFNSPHVLHYKYHPAEYTRTVEEFVRDCLKK